METVEKEKEAVAVISATCNLMEQLITQSQEADFLAKIEAGQPFSISAKKQTETGIEIQIQIKVNKV